MIHEYKLLILLITITLSIQYLMKKSILSNTIIRKLLIKNSSYNNNRLLLKCSTSSFENSLLYSISKSNSNNNNSPNFVFVGGKGGVGKTSCSSAIAINLSDQGLKTLIVSTDPAHSLGDAFDFDFSSGQITPIVTEQNLWALEIDVEKELEEFKQKASNLIKLVILLIKLDLFRN